MVEIKMAVFRAFQDKHLLGLEAAKLKYAEFRSEVSDAKYLPKERPNVSASDLIQIDYCYSLVSAFHYIMCAAGLMSKGNAIGPSPTELMDLMMAAFIKYTEEQIMEIGEKYRVLSSEIMQRYLDIDMSFLDKLKNGEIPFDQVDQQPEIQAIERQYPDEKSRID